MIALGIAFIAGGCIGIVGCVIWALDAMDPAKYPDPFDR